MTDLAECTRHRIVFEILPPPRAHGPFRAAILRISPPGPQRGQNACGLISKQPVGFFGSNCKTADFCYPKQSTPGRGPAVNFFFWCRARPIIPERNLFYALCRRRPHRSNTNTAAWGVGFPRGGTLGKKYFQDSQNWLFFSGDEILLRPTGPNRSLTATESDIEAVPFFPHAPKRQLSQSPKDMPPFPRAGSFKDWGGALRPRNLGLGGCF